MTDYTLTAESGAIVVTGYGIAMRPYAIFPASGGVSIVGSSVTLSRGRGLAAGVGVYAVTGSDVTLSGSFADLSEMHNFLSPKTASYTATNFNVSPQRIIFERGEKKSKIYQGHDTSNQRFIYKSASVFEVELQWDVLSESDAGTILDFYHDSAKACGILRTFQWPHPTDGYTYVVRFIGDISRSITPSNHHGIAKLPLAVDGYVS